MPAASLRTTVLNGSTVQKPQLSAQNVQPRRSALQLQLGRVIARIPAAATTYTVP